MQKRGAAIQVRARALNQAISTKPAMSCDEYGMRKM